jgi:hypothetical protein
MDLVTVAIDPPKHSDSGERGGRTEKRSAFHRHEFSSRLPVGNESTKDGDESMAPQPFSTTQSTLFFCFGGATRPKKRVEERSSFPDGRQLCSYWLYKSGLPGEEGRKLSKGRVGGDPPTTQESDFQWIETSR